MVILLTDVFVDQRSGGTDKSASELETSEFGACMYRCVVLCSYSFTMWYGENNPEIQFLGKTVMMKLLIWELREHTCMNLASDVG